MKKSLLLMVCLMGSMLVVASGNESKKSDSKKRQFSMIEEDTVSQAISPEVGSYAILGRYQIVAIIHQSESDGTKNLNPSFEESQQQSDLFNQHFAHLNNPIQVNLNENEQQDQ